LKQRIADKMSLITVDMLRNDYFQLGLAFSSDRREAIQTSDIIKKKHTHTCARTKVNLTELPPRDTS